MGPGNTVWRIKGQPQLYIQKSTAISTAKAMGLNASAVYSEVTDYVTDEQDQQAMADLKQQLDEDDPATAEPDETLDIGHDHVELYVGGSVVNGASGDRMIVRHFSGQEEEVVIFLYDTRRKVTRITLQMEINSSTAAVEAAVGYREKLEDVPEGDRQRLFAIYDRLTKISYPPIQEPSI
jgi:hypothetical protein